MASEYGWTSAYILGEVYPLDYFNLSETIQRRQIDEKIIQLRIVSTPHMKDDDARPFVEGLFERRRILYGVAVSEAKLDLEALRSFKKEMAENSQMIKTDKAK